MIYLVAIFMSPLYFLIRKRWGAFIVNSLFYGAALLCLVTIVGAFLAPIFWFVAAIHAVWHLRKEVMLEHADMIATKMAEKMAMPGRAVAPSAMPPDAV